MRAEVMIVKYDLVIFDMDGTVLDTLEDLLGAMNHALEGQHLGSRTLDEMRSYVGNGLYMMAVRACGVGAPRSWSRKPSGMDRTATATARSWPGNWTRGSRRC